MVEATPTTEPNDEGGDDTRTRRRRLSIVEVIAIVVVLGILATIVVFTVDNANQTAITSACAAEAKTIQTAVDSYRAKHHAGDKPEMSGPNSLVSDRDLSASSVRWTLSYHGTTPILSAIPGAGCRGNR
jgi:type II secretory pathway pseudopilin PulG